MLDLEATPTAPCDSSVTASIAQEVISEAHNVISALPTGEWRCSLKERLSMLEGAVEAWGRSEPTIAERKQVTAVAINFLSELLHHPGV